MACKICERTGKIVYEDELIIAYLEDAPFTEGHIVIVPKKHAPIIENVPDEVVIHAFRVANKFSSITFEVLGAMGTNILVCNGTPAGQEEPHFKIHVIPRVENDGLSFEWATQKLEESQFEALIEKFKQEEEVQKIPDENEDNYFLKSLNRIP